MFFEFLSGAAQGVAGNLLTRLLDTFWGNLFTSPDESLLETPSKQTTYVEVEPPRLFQTFHIKSGFESVLNAVIDPVVHVLIEDKPTTAWHLAILVVESRTTGEWYVSSKGEMAFEGSGGGVAVSERVASICSNRRVPVAGWVCSQSLSDSLSCGRVVWPSAKAELIPLITYAKSEHFAKYIVNRYREINA